MRSAPSAPSPPTRCEPDKGHPGAAGDTQPLRNAAELCERLSRETAAPDERLVGGVGCVHPLSPLGATAVERVPPCVDQCLKGGVQVVDKDVDAIHGYLVTI